VTTQNVGHFAAPPTLDYATPASEPALRAAKVADRYFLCLCLVLFGYAVGGRGFAYWGVNPLFVGEIMLAIGVLVLIRSRLLSTLLCLNGFLPLMFFMIWGCICTIPYLEKYGKDSIRDAVVWGYGTYSFIVAALLISDPTRVQRLVIYYRKFVILFLVLAPITTIISGFFEEYLPPFPGGVVPIIQVKGGDICVHLAGVFSYIVALGSDINPWFSSLMLPLNLGLNVQGRAGMVAFGVALTVAMALRPFHPRMMRILFVISIGLFFFWASDIKIERGARELSFEFLTKAVTSVVKESDDDTMEGTKEWRKRWWGDIINYTFHGPYFWMGKGFGINLADSDGYQVDEDGALRSPHNGHLTMLARAGVPGFSLWILTQLTWGAMIVATYIQARKQRLRNWSGLFMFLGSYWAAFMANATFDVFLEGPMGGIWLWCIYGAGIGCIYVFRHHPHLLTPPPAAPAPVFVNPPVKQGLTR
jgi:hypothetical protein